MIPSLSPSRLQGLHCANNIVQEEERQNLTMESDSRQISLEFLRAAHAELAGHGCPWPPPRRFRRSGAPSHSHRGLHDRQHRKIRRSSNPSYRTCQAETEIGLFEMIKHKRRNCNEKRKT